MPRQRNRTHKIRRVKKFIPRSIQQECTVLLWHMYCKFLVFLETMTIDDRTNAKKREELIVWSCVPQGARRHD